MISKSITSALLAPLVVGIIYISYQFNAKKEVEFSDLFIGFRQIPHKSLFMDSFTGSIQLAQKSCIDWHLSFHFHRITGVFLKNTSAIKALENHFLWFMLIIYHGISIVVLQES